MNNISDLYTDLGLNLQNFASLVEINVIFNFRTLFGIKCTTDYRLLTRKKRLPNLDLMRKHRKYIWAMGGNSGTILNS